MQLLSIILPVPEELNDGTKLCHCYNMNFSPKLATKQVSSIYSFIKVVSNNGMPVPLSQYESRDLQKKSVVCSHSNTCWLPLSTKDFTCFLPFPFRSHSCDGYVTNTHSTVPHAPLAPSLHFYTSTEVLRGN